MTVRYALVVLLAAVGLWAAWQRNRREWVGLLAVPAVT